MPSENPLTPTYTWTDLLQMKLSKLTAANHEGGLIHTHTHTHSRGPGIPLEGQLIAFNPSLAPTRRSLDDRTPAMEDVSQLNLQSPLNHAHTDTISPVPRLTLFICHGSISVPASKASRRSQQFTESSLLEVTA